MVQAAKPELSRVVVVGASLAGLRAVEGLRRLGYAGELTWLGDEIHAPYDRPPLSKQLLLGSWEVDKLRFRRKQGYDELGLNLIQGVHAVGLAADRNLLLLDEGTQLEFDGMVVATGARARMLPGAMPTSGIFSLRTLDDAIALRDALRQGKPRVAVVGAGFIGLEVASVCRTLGLEVTVVEQATLPLARILGDSLARMVVDLHEGQGVTFHTGVGVEQLLGDHAVEGVKLDNGAVLPAEVVVVGIGVQPNVEWLEDSGVELDNGVKCDTRCATTRADIVACGDVASFYNERFGVRQRIEHWTHAVEMAAAAAARLVQGPDVPAFAPVPYFWSDQYDVKLQFAGHITDQDEVHVIEGSAEERKLTALIARQGALCGVLTWNNPGKLIRFRKAIGDGATLQQALEL